MIKRDNEIHEEEEDNFETNIVKEIYKVIKH